MKENEKQGKGEEGARNEETADEGARKAENGKLIKEGKLMDKRDEGARKEGVETT